jgi:hypothetical protein
MSNKMIVLCCVLVLVVIVVVLACVLGKPSYAKRICMRIKKYSKKCEDKLMYSADKV